MVSPLTLNIDDMTLPSGWDNERICAEAAKTINLIRRVHKSSGMVVLGPKEVEHLTNLFGYVARGHQAFREAFDEIASKNDETADKKD